MIVKRFLKMQAQKDLRVIEIEIFSCEDAE